MENAKPASEKIITKKKSIPLWRDFDLGRIFIWLSWGIVFGTFFILPDYENDFKESVYLLLRIGTIASVILIPMLLMPFVGTSKVLGHFFKTSVYPIVVPFLFLSLFLEIRRSAKKIVGHPLLGVFHYSVIFLAVIYGMSVKDTLVWEFLSPLLKIFIVTNILWATAWICKPMRFIASINGLIEKNKIKILESLAKSFLKSKKVEDSKSVIKLTDGLIKLCEKINSPFLITIIFISVMVPVLLANIMLFALVLKGEYLISSTQVLSGDLFTPDNIGFLKLSVASFIGHDLPGVEIRSHFIQTTLLVEAMSGMFFLVGIFFAYSAFGLIRASDTIKNFQSLMSALSDSLKSMAKDAGLEEGSGVENNDKSFIDAQFHLKVQKDGTQDFQVN